MLFSLNKSAQLIQSNIIPDIEINTYSFHKVNFI